MKSGAPARQAIGGLRNGASPISLVKSMMAPMPEVLAVALRDCLPRDLSASSKEVSNCSLNVCLLSGYLISTLAKVSLPCVYSNANMRFLNITLCSSGAVTLRMSVRLNVGFQEDLRNSSSALYRSYKTDLETAVSFGPRSFLTTKLFRLN